MVNLRKATQSDAQLLFEWANEPASRANAANPKAISWEEHVAWFTCKLSEESTYIYILTDLKDNIGVIRFEKSPEGFMISYSIDKNYRGQGFGTLILEKGMEIIRKTIENPIFIGYVKRGNAASEKIFSKLNFSIKREENIQDAKFIIYKK